LLDQRLRIGRQPGRRFGWAGLGRLLRYLDDHVSASVTGSMLDRKLDPSDELPLFEQVAAEVRRAIADGEIAAGQRLPSAKALAAVLEVNTNTVLRALHLLRDEGLLELRRGRGITVAGTPQQGAVLIKAKELVRFALRQGYARDELIQM